jgi:hypothetical protein
MVWHIRWIGDDQSTGGKWSEGVNAFDFANDIIFLIRAAHLTAILFLP